MSDKDYSIDAHERWQRKLIHCDNDIVIEDHYNIVHNICHYYQALNRSLEYSELEQVGMTALMKAKCCWNPDKHSKWLTYASGKVKIDVYRKCIKPYLDVLYLEDLIDGESKNHYPDSLIYRDDIANNIDRKYLEERFKRIIDNNLTVKEKALITALMDGDVLLDTSKELGISRGNSYAYKIRALHKLFVCKEVRDIYRELYGEIDSSFSTLYSLFCEKKKVNERARRKRIALDSL